MRIKLISLAVMVVSMLGAVAHGQQERPESVEDYLSRCEAFGWSGSALVVRDGEVVCEGGYGLADRSTGRANDADTLFEVASLTKVFTACAVMLLVEDGKVDLDASIGEYLPGVPPDKRGITVRHLLSHSSGMPRSGPSGGGDDLEQAVMGYLSGPVAAAPGKRGEYWNGGFALLAGIIERVSRQSYQAFCKERVFEPAGMASTGFTGDDFDDETLATGYDGTAAVRTAAGHPYSSYGWHYKGMGGVVTSANDLRRFVNAYEGGKLLKRSTMRAMETVQVGTHGLGWGVTQTIRDTPRVGHGGDVRGFHCYLVRFPEEKALVIVLANSDGVPCWKLAWNIESLLFDQPLRTKSTPAVDADADPAAIVGTYESEDGDRMVVRSSGSGVRIGAVGADAMAALEPSSVGREANSALVQARAILNAVVESRPEEIKPQLAVGIPPSWPDVLCSSIWKAHVRDHGAFEGAEPMGARSIGPGAYEVLISLTHEDEPARLRVVINRGKLQIFDLNGPEYLIDAPMAIMPDGGLARFDWATDEVVSRIGVQREDGAVALVVEREGKEPLEFRRVEGP